MAAESNVVEVIARGDDEARLGRLIMTITPGATPDKVRARVQYFPEPGSNPDSITFACMAIGAKPFDSFSPERSSDGSYQFEREFYADETSPIQVFQDRAPATGPPILETKLSLTGGRLARECYYDEALPDEQRGRLEQRVL